MPCSMPQTVRVDYNLAIARHWNARFRGWIMLVLTQDHIRVWIVRKLKPCAYYPAFAVGIESIVVIQMQVMNSFIVSIGVELDDTHSPIICSYIFGPLYQCGTNSCIFRPDTILVGLTVIPEARALHFTKRRSDWREVRVTATFPVHIFEAHPFLLRNVRAIVITQYNKALFGKGIKFEMHSVTPY